MSDKLDRKYPSFFIHVANKYPARWGYVNEGDILCQGHSGIFRTPELDGAKKLAGIVYDHPRLRSILFRLYGQRFVEALADILTGRRTYRAAIRNPANYLKLLKIGR